MKKRTTRQRFETWAKRAGFDLYKDYDGGYWYGKTHGAWRGFQAGLRAAKRVKP